MYPGFGGATSGDELDEMDEKHTHLMLPAFEQLLLSEMRFYSHLSKHSSEGNFYGSKCSDSGDKVMIKSD